MIALLTYFVFALFGALCAMSFYRCPGNPFRPVVVGIHALSCGIILLAATANGIMFDASTYLGDLWTAFEAITKAAHGARSGIDYFNPIGPVYEWAFRAALSLRPPSAAVLPLASALVATLVLGATVLMLSRRVSPLAVALTGLVAVAAATSPREADALFVQAEVTFLAPYNRWGWALFGPVIFLFAAPARTRDFLGPAIAGVLIALMLLLKPTYGVAAIGMAVVTAVVLPGRGRDAVIAGCAILVTLAVLEAVTGQVISYAQDLSETARMPHSDLRLLKLSKQFGEFGLAMMVSTCLLYALYPGPERPGGVALQGGFLQPVLLLSAAGGAGWMVLMQNHSATEAIVYPLMPLLVAEWSGLFAGDPGRRQIPRPRAGSILLILLVALFRPLTDAGYVAAQSVQLMRHERDEALAGGYMHDLVIHPRRWAGNCNGTCKDYQRMRKGLELLHQVGADIQEAGAVLALNFSNPFPFLLGKAGPPGTPIWTHIGRSISSDQHPPAEEFFAGVDYVLLAIGEPSGEAIARIYQSDIAATFEERAANAQWRLYIRRPK